MTHELVRETEIGVDDVVLADQDEVVEAPAGTEAELVDHLEVAHETERASGRDLLAVSLAIGENEIVVLLADRRRVAQQVRDREDVRRLYDQRLVAAAADLVTAVDDQLLYRCVLVHHPHLLEVLEEAERGTIDDRDLAVDLDQEVCDAAGVQRRQQMLDRTDALAVAGQGGGVVGLGHRAHVRGHRDPARQGDEVDPGVGRQRLDHHAGAAPRVQSEAVDDARITDRSLRPVGGLEHRQLRRRLEAHHRFDPLAALLEHPFAGGLDPLLPGLQGVLHRPHRTVV